MRLGELVKEWRWAKKINVRDAAKEIGISAATLSRFERGNAIDGDVLSKLLRWSLMEIECE